MAIPDDITLGELARRVAAGDAEAKRFEKERLGPLAKNFNAQVRKTFPAQAAPDFFFPEIPDFGSQMARHAEEMERQTKKRQEARRMAAAHQAIEAEAAIKRQTAMLAEIKAMRASLAESGDREQRSFRIAIISTCCAAISTAATLAVLLTH